MSSMALISLVKVRSRGFNAKCSEPQVGISNSVDTGSGVAKFLNLSKGMVEKGLERESGDVIVAEAEGPLGG